MMIYKCIPSEDLAPTHTHTPHPPHTHTQTKKSQLVKSDTVMNCRPC